MKLPLIPWQMYVMQILPIGVHLLFLIEGHLSVYILVCVSYVYCFRRIELVCMIVVCRHVTY